MAELYSNAARVVDKILQKKGTPKTLVLENTRVEKKKMLYALVCQTLKYKTVTDQLLEATKLLSLEKQLSYPMALVLVYDFLFGRGLYAGGQLKQGINRNKTRLKAALARMKVKAKVINNEDLLPANIQKQTEIPRYVRVNTLKTSTDDAIAWFSKNGFILQAKSQDTHDVSQMPRQSFSVDEHVPDLLVFPPGTDLHANTLYQEGEIILQDKASCFPAFALSPPPGGVVIDACAAPGNKTSHLAAIMENKGKIFAFDISEKRISTMKKLLHRSGGTIFKIMHQDFLKTKPADPVYKDVQYILVDPSCSGSGMINRLDHAISVDDDMDTKERQRLQSLAYFQEKALRHALSFPNVKRAVYSTCSLHDRENEEVVKNVLEKFHEKFELKTAMPNWPYRGHPIFSEASKCVRASPKEGSTSGFFLALFEAKHSKQERTGCSDAKTAAESTAVTKEETNEQVNANASERKSRKRKIKDECTTDNPEAASDLVKKKKRVKEKQKRKNRKNKKRHGCNRT